MKKMFFLGVAFLAIMAGIADISFAAPQVQPPAKIHKITTIEGTVINGEIVEITENAITVKDTILGVITIAREKIWKIEPPLGQEAVEAPAVQTRNEPPLEQEPVKVPAPQNRGEKPLHFFVGANLTFGGEILSTLYMSDDSKQNLRAGTLAEIKGGIDYLIIPSLSLRGSFGAHFGGISASNGGVNFFRFPLEGLAHFHLNKNINIGGGVRKAVGASLKGTGDFEFSQTMESSLGFVVEAEYKINDFVIVARFVSEKYRVSSGYPWVDGSHGGVGIEYLF